MRVTLCALNSQYIHSALAPWYLRAALRAEGDPGLEVSVEEGTINEPLAAVGRRILAGRPEVVGCSCYIWNIEQTEALVRWLKERRPALRVVLGGPEVSFCAAAALRRNPAVDYIIAGEGEQPLTRLLNALRRGEDISAIPGLCCRSGEQVRENPPAVATGEPPSPYGPEYLAALKGRIAYLETSRGCPFHCAFCLSGREEGARYFEVETAKERLLLLANSGAQTVKLIDRTFNARRGRAYELWQFIIDRYGTAIPSGVCFHFEIAGDLLDAAALKLLATAPPGAMQMEIGLQSFNPATLRAIRRPAHIDRLKANIRALRAAGNIHLHIDLIAGLPHEGGDSLAHSFNTAYALKPHRLQLGFLKLLPGAPLREQPQRYPCRYDPHPPYEVRATPWLSAEELRALHPLEDALQRLYNSGRFRRTLAYLLEHSGATPFALFERIAAATAGRVAANISLDDYTALLFSAVQSWPEIDRAELRDAMVCDRLATNASGLLPPILWVQEPRLRQVKIALESSAATRRPPGVKRGLAWLYTQDCAVYADYIRPHPVTGEYRLWRVPPP